MKRNHLLGLALVIAAVMLSCATAWAVPGLLSYQGKLQSTGGTAIDGTFEMRFALYDAAADGTLLWEEEQSVVVAAETYNVALGSTNVLVPELFQREQVYLQVAVYNPDTDGWEVLLPRQRMTSSAYALVADEANTLDGLNADDFSQAEHSHDFGDITGLASDAQIPDSITIQHAVTAGDADRVDGHHAADFAPTGHSHAGSDITSGTIAEPRIDSAIARDSELTWARLLDIPDGFADGVDNNSGGDITSVLAGTGLNGGGSSGDVTLNVQIPLQLSGAGSTGTTAIIKATNTASGYGLYGEGNTGTAVYGRHLSNGCYGYLASNSGVGAMGYSGSSGNVGALGTALAGVKAIGTDTHDGVYGSSENGKAIHGYSSGGWGGYFEGPVEISANDGPHLVIRDSNFSNDRPGIQFLNNNIHFIAADDLSDELFGLYSKFDKWRTYDAHWRVHGKAANSWGTYLEMTHDGSDGILSTDIGDILLQPAGNVGIGTATPVAKVHSVVNLASINYGETSRAGYFENNTDTFTTKVSLGEVERYPDEQQWYVSGLHAEYGHSATYATLATPNYAGYFKGSVQIAGTLTKSSGAFKIDHPLDPENKYLYHSFVESPDMMNVYNGNVVLDDTGEAWVELPDWFEALNVEFRYQLTPIGAPGPNLFIAEEITNHRFKIAGGSPSLKVSWQVTGTRHDAYALAHPIVVEEDKPDSERGTYLHPELYQ